jgi:uncharacterized repeat protein (TIGR03803 family)
MPQKKRSTAPIRALMTVAMALILASSAWAGSRYKVLHAFGKGNDGAGLWASLVFDANGNLYGTTSGGGTYGQGTVFKLTPSSNGKWSETVVHSFPSSSNDGQDPTGNLNLGRCGQSLRHDRRWGRTL